MDYQQQLAYVKSLGYNDDEAVKILADRGIFNTSADPRTVAGLKNLGREAVQGATFNFGDELAGMLPDWLQKHVTGTRDEIRAKSKAFEKEHPIASTAAQVAGSLALPGGAAGEFLNGSKTILGTIGRGAALGGAAGGLAGAGAAEGDLGNRLQAAEKPALAGAVLGGALPGVLGAARAATSPTARAGSRLQSAIDRSGGIDALIRRSQEFEKAGRGSEVALADLTMPLRQASDYSANNSEQAYEAISKIAQPRQAGQSNRLLDDVTSQVGNPQGAQIADDLAKGTQQWAQGPSGYGGLRAQNPEIIPAMAEDFNGLLQTPAVKNAWQQAREIGLIGPMPKSGSVSFDVMQGTLERLNTAKEAAFNRGANDLAFRLKSAADGLEQQMGKAVPGYTDVAQQYGVRKSLERAVKRGEEIFDEEDTRGLAKELSQMTTPQLAQLRQGLASKLITRLRSAQTNKNEAARLLNRSSAMEDKLQLVFGDQKTFEEFIKKAELEAEMSKLKGSVGGSATHRRDAAHFDPAVLAAEAAVSPEAAAFVAARNALPVWLRGATAKAMAPDLATQGSANIERLLREWKKRPGLLPGLLGRAAPVGLGVGAASASSLFD